jgi:formylglycine-generating enzyme required for sulfatase activity
MEPQGEGKIITFYSYKGGTGRSMTLANVAWLLANAGRRVLMIDWDLEAPGLHRYFEPFIADRKLENSTGVIDWVLDFATAAVSINQDDPTPGQNIEHGGEWFRPYANILAHAVPVNWQFAGGGVLHLVPAGRQDSGYGSRVNSFDWSRFYERLGGGILLEALKQVLRKNYDFILIDSRTGVSDTSGVCTVQMPDELVICFTLNRQSIYGASAAATSMQQQRKPAGGLSTLKIWPVPMRIELSEKDRLEAARALARIRFSSLLHHITPEVEDVYWGEIEVPYQPYYAYEEVLATFRDRPRETLSLLSSMETITRYLTAPNSISLLPMDDESRKMGLQSFLSRPASAYFDEMILVARQYEHVRGAMEAGGSRTYLMTSLMSRAQALVGSDQAGQTGEKLFKQQRDGTRVTGLALARKEPLRGHIDMALDGISNSRSAFEQYFALLLAQQIAQFLDPTAKAKLQTAITDQLGKTITEQDQGRWRLSQDLIKSLPKSTTQPVWKSEPIRFPCMLGDSTYDLIEIRPTSPSTSYNDIDEHHGRFLVSRGSHTIKCPQVYRAGELLVTNELFLEFAKAGGYQREELWTRPGDRRQLTTLDRKSFGPADWPGSTSFPNGKGQHPVTGICRVEADAFIKWSNSDWPAPTGWQWALMSEDIWEYTARTEAGLSYPWGDAFDGILCNSAESGIGDTCEVNRFRAGASRYGCCDMAGNVWEFVQSEDQSKVLSVLRGGSYKNSSSELRSYLRLVRVPVSHRPLDFGFRLVQVTSEPTVL